MLANLDVLAPDALDPEIVATALEGFPEELVLEGSAEEPSNSPGAVSKNHGVTMVFDALDQSPAERRQMMAKLVSAAQARLKRRNLWTPLRVLRLELTDFRGIDQLTLRLSENATTVLVGANGSGKTTLLDATALLLSRLETGIRKSSRRPRALLETDIMNGHDSTNVTIAVRLGQMPVTWSQALSRRDLASDLEERANQDKLGEEIEGLHEDVETGYASVPIAVYYSVNRAVVDIPLRGPQLELFKATAAYDGALNEGRSNFRLFFEWFREREDLENETRIHNSQHRDHQLQAVRDAISALVPEFSDLRVQRAPLRMLVTKGSWTLYVDQLSDGEKCLLAMVGDLARRLAMANPLADDPLLGGGVVMIDEIELHLHPGWQRRIVPDLERTFPHCQFIVTTHSPAVLGHVDRDSIFILKPERDRIVVVKPEASKGLDVNRILEDLFEVSERPKEFKDKLDRLHDLIDQGDTEGARKLHAELAATLGPSEPALVRAEVLLRRREAGKK